MPLPSSTSQTVRRSAFGCRVEAVIWTTTTLSMFAPRRSVPSISTPASVSNSASASTLGGRSTISRNQLTENFIFVRLSCRAKSRHLSIVAVRDSSTPLGMTKNGSCELFQKSQIVLRKKPDVWNIEQNHGEPVHAQAECITGPLFRIVGDIAARFIHFLKNTGMHHSRTGDLDPLFAAFQCLGLHIDFETWFGEWKIMRTKPNRGLLPEKFVHEKLKRTFKIGDTHIFIHIEALDLMKLRTVGRVHFVAAICRSGGDYADRRRRRFHRPDLDSRSMRSKQTSIRQIKCVLLVARRMFGRRVESVETMPFRLNVRAVRKGETHSTEDRDRAVEYLGKRMQRPLLAWRSWQ